MSWCTDHLIDVFRKAGHSPEGWSKAADEFLVRVSETAADTAGSSRDENCALAAAALERSGRTSEVILFLTEEAAAAKSYVRLFKYLVRFGMADEALNQAEKGILAAFLDPGGQAEELRRLRAELWTEKQEWVPVLGYYICNTAEKPSSSKLEDVLYGPIKETARHLKRWPEVRAFILEFLETGTLPWEQAGGAWLKPDQAELAGRKFRDVQFPQAESLVRIAVCEKQPAEILKWYDRLLEDRAGSSPWAYRRPFFENRLDLEVAKAVINFDPGRTLEIWKKAAESSIAETNRGGYQRAGSFLINIRDLMIKLKKENEWQEYLAGLRSVHKRKRVLLEELDNL
jgi:uncharacterized Zn finger protein